MTRKTRSLMTQHVALYGFVRRREGLKVRPKGIGKSNCFLFHVGGGSAAVISPVNLEEFQATLPNMVRHEEVVEELFQHQAVLPVKFPKVIGLRMLRRSLLELDHQIASILDRIVFKAEYQVRVYLLDSAHGDLPATVFNAYARYFLENANRFRYKHYFPLLTQEAKEAEFLYYAEQVVHHISQRLIRNASFWRARSFSSDRVIFDAVFWIRRHRSKIFINEIKELRRFYPNLKISVMGPRPPYNFVRINFRENG